MLPRCQASVRGVIREGSRLFGVSSVFFLKILFLKAILLDKIA